MKPFKPPSLIRKDPDQVAICEPPAKRRRISDRDARGDDIQAVTAAIELSKNSPPTTVRSFPPSQRKPLEERSNLCTASQSTKSDIGIEGFFIVLWRKFTTKKNKTWDGDGVLSVVDGVATLQDVSGKQLGKTVCKSPLLVGSELAVSGKDVEVQSTICKADFLAGRPFLGRPQQQPAAPPLKDVNAISRLINRAPAHAGKVMVMRKESTTVASTSFQASRAAFKTPLVGKTAPQPTKDAVVPIPRHDPNAEGALVMRRPKSAPKGKHIVDVVVDPILTKSLRKHQRAGVAFLYECVMGMKAHSGEGAILADDMGLGKTLQTIALLWTLMKQNPIYQDPPVVKKALIVCPVSLINNWRREFHKWLGKERIGVLVAESKKTRLTDFTMGRAYNVMIIGYEKLRLVQEELQKGSGIDIVIADEGHRLKTAQNKAALAIKSLNTERRVILSGTPIQNDLAEFYTMVDFVNPGLLNKYSVFKREFENPILKGRQPGADTKDIEKGEGRSAELATITGMFILRRTAEILSQYLPPKTEYVVFCRPTEAQKTVYRAIIGSSIFNAALGSSAMALELINILKKACNSPTLLLKKGEKGEGATEPELLKDIPRALLRSPGASGKLQVLDSLLHHIRTTTEEKVVLVSNYTSTMDILGNLLSSLSYKYLRLDGSTPPGKRQELVDRFNRSPPSNSFVFLLSAKAGGVGLNLIGASRLILFDLDWNPATDLQAMARVHRDGQKRPCFIYRLLTQGALDEKIFQRQVSKTGLADSIVDGKAGVSGFTREELRDLFSLDEGERCQTHELLGCTCGGKPLDALENAAPVRNDLASLSVEANDFLDIESSRSPKVIRMNHDSDGELLKAPSRPTWTTASQVDMQAQEAEVQREARKCVDMEGKAKMLSLMQYAHFDTALDIEAKECDAEGGSVEDESFELNALESAIEDDALRTVIREDGGRIGFVFTKTSM